MAFPISKKALIFSASALFLFTLALSAQAATLFVSPSSGAYSTGKNFTVSIVVGSADQAMNAAEGVLDFPTDKLQVVGVSKAGSIFNLWAQEPSYSNSGTIGNVRFEGVVFNPGYQGGFGKILDVTFRVRAVGAATISFSSGQVYANDGLATPILSSFGKATYTLQQSTAAPASPIASGLPGKPSLKHFIKKPDGEVVAFNTSEDPLKWSNSSYSNLSWLLSQDVKGVVAILDESADTNPGTKSAGLFDSKTYNFLEEGKHYFHLRFINDVGAGPILHYPVFVDLTPPEPFAISFTFAEAPLDSDDIYSTSNPKPRIAFVTTDKVSGVDRYEFRVDKGSWINAQPYSTGQNQYTFPKQSSGAHTLTIRAYDKAGNYVDAITKLTIQATSGPVITSYTKSLVSPGQKALIEGTGTPDAQIEVKLSIGDAEPIILSGRVNSEGNWSVVYGEILPSGTYAITAKQILSNGAESQETEPVYMRVNSFIWRFVQWLKNIGGSLLLLIIFLGLIVVLGYYYWHKFGLLRRRLRREAHEAEDALKRGISKIKREIAEGEGRAKLSKDVEAIGKVVEKEIKDLEKF